jgi:NADH-quinone oxidoreductase subunit B
MGLLDLFKGKFVDPTYPSVHEGGNIITTTLSSVVRWGRRSSIWPMPFGTACCAIEFMALAASHYDLARFGAEVLRFSPRQSDLMFVAGTIPDKLAPVLKTIYDQMPEPKWVISMGVCASTGGMYDSYAVVQGVDTILPVDMYVPGCPPRPDAVIDAILKLQKRIQRETPMQDLLREPVLEGWEEGHGKKLENPNQHVPTRRKGTILGADEGQQS